MQLRMSPSVWIGLTSQILGAVLLGTLATVGPIADDSEKDVGTFRVDLRYRFESVRNDAPQFLRDAQASTLRTSFGYSSPSLAGLQARVTFENVADVGFSDDHFNAGAGSLSNGIDGRPVIADPEITDVLEAAVDYFREGIVRATIGRSALNLGEERFVGAVAWRQHWQTFDMAGVTFEIPRGSVSAHYLDRVNRLFGDSIGMDSVLLTASLDVGPVGIVTPYGYRLDYEDPAFSALSTQTAGVRIVGSRETDAVKFGWHGEWATQEDVGGNRNDVDATYSRVQVSVDSKRFGGTIMREALGGSVEDGAFATPLATLHKWNGFADLFLTTPTNGLVDTLVKFSYKQGALKAFVTFHQFESDSAGLDYGNEVDAQMSWTSAWKQSFAIKYAAYDADDFGADRNIFWLFTSYSWASR